MNKSIVCLLVLLIGNVGLVKSQDDCDMRYSLASELYKVERYAASYQYWHEMYQYCMESIKSKNFFIIGQKLLYKNLEASKEDVEAFDHYRHILKVILDKRRLMYPEDSNLINQVNAAYNLSSMLGKQEPVERKLIRAADNLKFQDSFGVWGYLTSEEGNIKLLVKDEKSFDLVFPDNRIWVFSGGLNKYTATFSTREGRVTISAEFVSPKMIKIKEVRKGDGIFGPVTTERSYALVKDLRSNIDSPIKKFSENGLVFRYDIKSGKIGEDYIPPTYDSYNAGKTFYLGGIEVKEKNMQSYVKEGGYNRDVQGYTYVFQIINSTDKIFKVNYSTGGHGKFPNTEKSYFIGIDLGYRTVDEHLNFESKNFIVLRPQKTFKDQITLGTTIPIDFEFVVDKIEEFDVSWMNGLENALKTTSDLALIDRYLADSRASDWYDKLNQNRSSVIKAREATLFHQYLPLIESSIRPKDDLFFDKDFESEVLFTIKNNSDRKLLLAYSVCDGENELITLNSLEKFDGVQKVKGFTKGELTVKIKQIKIPE